MNKLASALMGAGGTGGSAGKSRPGGSNSLALTDPGSTAPAASAPTTALPSRGLGPVAAAPPVPPASPRPPSPTAPAGKMTTPEIGPNIATGLSRRKMSAEKLRSALLSPKLPTGMRPIEPPKPPAPPKPFKPKDPGTTKSFQVGATAGTI